jgi:hypothetical protein
MMQLTGACAPQICSRDKWSKTLMDSWLMDLDSVAQYPA